MKRLSLALGLILIAFSAVSQTWQDSAALIEKIFSLYKSSGPGCQIAISRNGQAIYSNAWGMADLEHNSKLTTESIIEAGSVSKQFTAACILLLEQQGKLSQNDDVRKYIPELPNYGSPILIKFLIHHTSGIKDWKSISALGGFPQGSRVYDNEDVLDIVCRQTSLNNTPNTEFLYSNSNYNLLAVIIERVSGMELADFSKKYIFEPAGMRHTKWRNHFRDVVPNRAIAYGFNGDFFFSDMPNENAYGNGGLLTTAEDLLLWNKFYQSGKLGNPSLLNKQLETIELKNGYNKNYAAGLYITSSKGWKMIGHDGSTAGYRCDLRYYPDLNLSFAWLSNTSQFDPQIQDFLNSLESIFIVEKKTSDKSNVPNPMQLTQKTLHKYDGWYKNTNSGEAIRLSVKDSVLMNMNRGLIPVQPGRFYIGSMDQQIIFAGDQKSFLAIAPGIDSVKFIRIDSIQITKENRKDYLGNYYSKEVQSKMSVIWKDNKLCLVESAHNTEELEPTYRDGFKYWRGSLYFERDRHGSITEMKITLPRARNESFARLAK